MFESENAESRIVSTDSGRYSFFMLLRENEKDISVLTVFGNTSELILQPVKAPYER